MKEEAVWRASVRGVVQGVGFRPTVKRVADAMGIRGFVRNDGSSVTIVASGDMERFIEGIRGALGPIADMTGVDMERTTWGDEGLKGPPSDFSIRPSTAGRHDSQLPPDTAMCGPCIREMLDPGDRRFLHPFTNCTDCGARYTVIESVPYDRERTSMGPYMMCPHCSAEYGDVTFRRFHAQTLSCPVDGPVYRYVDRAGNERARGYAAVMETARTILGGGRAIVKGWGGMHIVCDPSRLAEMRAWYKRPYKPFAIMCADLETVREIAVVDPWGERAVNSPARPIALLRKRDDPPAWAVKGLELASPGLDSVGLYLPYAGVHHLLFRALREHGSDLRWLVMTSANLPGEPMGLELEDVMPLGADGYLVHDRMIVARCDDSVVIPDPIPPDERASSKGPSGMEAFMIRRSRGIVPMPIPVGHSRTVLGLGAERNLTTTLTSNGMAYATPYLGNSRVPDVLDYAAEATERIRSLFGGERLDAVVVDKHPGYVTNRWGKEMAEEEGTALLEVQHHHAHAASLMVDAGLDHLSTVVLDGVGFGDDGTPWGAEVLDSDLSVHRRIGHIAPFGLPGGDSAVHHPERIAFWLSRDAGHRMTLHDPAALEALERTRGSSIMTTSMGRLLDALAAISLGITWRTYDGEPAMRLETLLGMSGAPSIEAFPTDIGPNGVVNIRGRWGALLHEMFGNEVISIPRSDIVPTRRTADLVAGFVFSVMDDLVEVASGASDGRGVGISGGVAYDLPIVRSFVRSCKVRGIVPILHSRVPPGDGGVSIGQAAAGGHML